MIQKIFCNEVIKKNAILLRENEDLKKKVVEIKEKSQATVNAVNKYYKGRLRNLGGNKDN